MGRIVAGDLRERFTLITPTTGPSDGRGGHLPGTATEESVWAAVEVVNAGERLRNGQIANYNGLRVTIRRKAGVSPKQRGRWGTQSVNITAVTPDQGHEYLVLTCVNGGQ